MNCHSATRRQLLGGGASGFFSFAMLNRLHQPLEAATVPRAKRCLVLWMNGGPSQLDTFDPKPGSSTGGEFQAIATSVPGLRISETLPNVAEQMHELCVLRCLSSTEGEHERAQYYLHTGFPLVAGFPRPSTGAIVSHETHETGFPRYVSIGSPGYGPAYMGPDHAPFSIENAEEALGLLRGIRRKRNRIELLQQLGKEFDQNHSDPSLSRRRAMVGRISEMVTTPFLKALNLDAEPKSIRGSYGVSPFGNSCLLARRLLEVGVNFVEVQQDGWDTHSDNFAAVRRLTQAIDKPWATLMADLRARGMLDDTLVIWMGEFGRTPRINPNRGRDHFPAVTPVVMGGAGLKAGIVFGETNRTGTEIIGQKYRVPDLLATVFSLVGIDYDQQFQTSFGGVANATDHGQPIQALL